MTRKQFDRLQPSDGLINPSLGKVTLEVIDAPVCGCVRVADGREQRMATFFDVQRFGIRSGRAPVTA